MRPTSGVVPALCELPAQMVLPRMKCESTTPYSSASSGVMPGLATRVQEVPPLVVRRISKVLPLGSPKDTPSLASNIATKLLKPAGAANWVLLVTLRQVLPPSTVRRISPPPLAPNWATMALGSDRPKLLAGWTPAVPATALQSKSVPAGSFVRTNVLAVAPVTASSAKPHITVGDTA